MSKLDDILDLLADQIVDLRKELHALDLSATAGEVDRLHEAIKTLVFNHSHPICWACDRHRPGNEFEPTSRWFPYRVCRDCYNSIPRRRLPRRSGSTQTENFARRYKNRLEQLGILFVVQDPHGGVTHNYDQREVAEKALKSMQKLRA